MALTVVFDPQWSLVRFLKPFPNFEEVYQGQPLTTPIAFPGVLDSYAERRVPGYDPNLIAGVTVPLGSRVTIWIPLALTGGAVAADYQYQIIWRLRTIADFVQGQVPGNQTNGVQEYSSYHVGVGPLGQPSSSSDKRYFLPGALQTAVFPQAEPADGVPAVKHLIGELLQPLAAPVWSPPLTPKGETATWQQGVYPSAGSNQTGPSFMIYSFEALGDELSILASRIDPDDGDTWDFTSAEPGDAAFSETYGNSNGESATSPYTGILVMTGAPS